MSSRIHSRGRTRTFAKSTPAPYSWEQRRASWLSVGRRCPIVCCLLFLAIVCSIQAEAGTYLLPEPGITLELDPTVINAGEYATVRVILSGSLVNQTKPIPASIVLALDESGSMGINDAYKDSRQAAVDFLALLKPLEPLHSVTVIAIGGQANKLIGPTSDIDAAIAAVNSQGFPGSSSTNIIGAFDLTNSILKSQPSQIRMAILLTDGYQSGASKHVEKHIKDVNDANIQYFTVGFGSSVATDFLSTLASETGGYYYFAGTNSAQLSYFFKEIFAFNENGIHLRKVGIVDTLSGEISVEPGSFSHSFPLSLDMEASISTFEATSPHSISLPTIIAMNHKTDHTYAFRVTVDHCEDNDVTYEVHDTGKSYVTFATSIDVNKPHTKFFSGQFGENQLTVRRCGFKHEKVFDDSKSQVKVILTNEFNVPVYDIAVLETPAGLYFTPDIGTAVPQATLYKALPASPEGVVWTIEEIPPRTESEVAVRLIPTCAAWFRGQLPLTVNPKSITAVTSWKFYRYDDLVSEVSLQHPEYGALQQAIAGGTDNDIGVVIDFLKNRQLVDTPGPAFNFSDVLSEYGHPEGAVIGMDVQGAHGYLIDRFIFAEGSWGIRVYRTRTVTEPLGFLETGHTYDVEYWLEQGGVSCLMVDSKTFGGHKGWHDWRDYIAPGLAPIRRK